MKLGIFRSSVNGTVQGAAKWHEVTKDEKLGNLLLPQTEADYNDLLNGAGNNVTYTEMTPEELEVAGLDLRVYKIISKEKVDAVLSLPQKEQFRIIKVINENLTELLETAGIKPNAVLKKDHEKGSEDPPPFETITVKELHELLDAQDIEPPKNALKQELYDLAFPK